MSQHSEMANTKFIARPICSDSCYVIFRLSKI